MNTHGVRSRHKGSIVLSRKLFLRQESAHKRNIGLCQDSLAQELCVDLKSPSKARRRAQDDRWLFYVGGRRSYICSRARFVQQEDAAQKIGYCMSVFDAARLTMGLGAQSLVACLDSA